MADYHVRRSRMPSSSSDDYEDESLDPRIQVELEKLNKASEEINRLELELDDARASFRQTLSESTQKLDVLAKKLGSCVEKARPYYDARVKAKEAHLETQRAALRFERACSMHEAAKEMVQLAEQGYMRREQPSDPAWQEMLNHATMKVNEAEKERNESEQEHERTMIRFKQSEDTVQGLQKDLKRAITKSKPYFEMKARFNQIMEEHKQRVGTLEGDVGQAKAQYSGALRSLEAISDDIHQTRLQRRRHNQQLGVRGAGVGAECPLPPPPPHSWESGQKSLDPLGVMKVASTASYGGGGGGAAPANLSSSSSSSQHRRSRNLSGESAHGKEEGEREGGGGVGVGGEGSDPTPLSSPPSEKTLVRSEEEERGESSGGGEVEEDGGCCPSPVMLSPVSSPVLIPGDPLGVIPPVYHTKSKRARAPATSPSSSSSTTPTITHPAFAGKTTHHPHPAARSSHITHPFVTPTSTASAGDVAARRAESGDRPVVAATSTDAGQTFVPSSLLFANPEQARRESYRRAVESSQRPATTAEEEEEEEEEGVVGGEGGEEGVFWAWGGSRQRSHSSPAQPASYQDDGGPHPPRSPSKAIPPPHHPSHARLSPGQDMALADGRKHGSAPEQSFAARHRDLLLSEGGGAEESSSSLGRRQKLQGLILRIDPSMDPLRHFQQPQPPHNPPPGHASASGASPSTQRQSLSAQTSTTTTTTTTTPVQGEAALTPTTASNLSRPPHPPPHSSSSDYAISTNPAATHPIIRSASTVSNAGSERSEASEFSEVESVSATQSPTKPHPPGQHRARLLHVPASIDTVEDSSDTESLASTGPMLDDEQVEFLTMDFSDMTLDAEKVAATDGNNTLPSSSANLKRGSWSRMSLPPRLSYLEGFLARQAKRSSGEFDDIDDIMATSPCDDFDEDRAAAAMARMMMMVKEGREVISDDTVCGGGGGGVGVREKEKGDNCAEGELLVSSDASGKEGGVGVGGVSSSCVGE